MLANRLSADPTCRVLLLEAGGSDRKQEIRIPAAITKFFLSEYDWKYRTSKQPQLSDREIYWPRGKILGGSSAICGQAWTRGHRADYDGWAQTCPGWSYDEVVPYFQRAELPGGQQRRRGVWHFGPAVRLRAARPQPVHRGVPGRVRRAGPAPPRRAQRAGQHRVLTDPGDPAARAAAQRRRGVRAPGQAAT